MHKTGVMDVVAVPERGIEAKKCSPDSGVQSTNLPGREAMLDAHVLDNFIDRFLLCNVKMRNNVLESVPIVHHNVKVLWKLLASQLMCSRCELHMSALLSALHPKGKSLA